MSVPYYANVPLLLPSRADDLVAAGHRGWLNDAPALVAEAVKRWKLTDLHTLPAGFGGVVLGCTFKRQPAVLKISLYTEEAAREESVLRAWQGITPTVLAFDARDGAIVMERIGTGVTIRSFPEWQADLHALGQIIQMAHAAPIPRGLPTLSSFWETRCAWVGGHVRAVRAGHYGDVSSLLADDDLPRFMNQIRRLLGSSGDDRLLHGDLHLGNVILAPGRYAIVDPDGLVGDPCYDVARLATLDAGLLTRGSIPASVDMIAEACGVDADRVLDWTYPIAFANAIHRMTVESDAGERDRITEMLRHARGR